MGVATAPAPSIVPCSGMPATACSSLAATPRALELWTSAAPQKPIVTPASKQRLEALEARFDRCGGSASVRACSAPGGGPIQADVLGESGRSTGGTEGSFGKLRGQLLGLRTELLAGRAGAAAPSPRGLVEAEPTPIGSYTVPVQAPVVRVQPPLQQIVPLGATQPAQFLSPAPPPPSGAQMHVLTRSMPNLAAVNATPGLQPPATTVRKLATPATVTPPPPSGPVVVSSSVTAPAAMPTVISAPTMAAAPYAIAQTCNDVFTALDRNGDGVLSREEFAAATTAPMLLQPNTTELNALPRARSCSPPKSPPLVSASRPSSPPTMLAAPVSRILLPVSSDSGVASCQPSTTVQN